MRSHPARPVLGPEPLHDARNCVLPLLPMFGPSPWDASSEVGPRDDCGRCGGEVRAHWIFCAGCHRVAPIWERKLAAELRCVPRPDRKPAAAPAATQAVPATAKRVLKTARDRKRMEQAARAYKDDPSVREWADEHGLAVA